MKMKLFFLHRVCVGLMFIWAISACGKTNFTFANLTDVQAGVSDKDEQKEDEKEVEAPADNKENEVGESSARSESNSTDDTNAPAQSRKPTEFFLKSEEWTYPKEWSERILGELDYDLLVPDFPYTKHMEVLKIKRLLIEKKYDAVVAACMNEFTENFSNGLRRKNVNLKKPLYVDPVLFRTKAYCCAAALELSGDLYAASVGYQMLYPQTGLGIPRLLSPSDWQRLRLIFESFIYNVGTEFSSLSDAEFFEHGFRLLDLCKLIVSTCPYDDIDPILERFSSGNAWRTNIFLIPVSIDDPLYASAYKLYLIRDNLARFMYPGLHFFQCNVEKYKTYTRYGKLGLTAEAVRNKELALLTRKSFSEFIKLLEKYLGEIERRKERGFEDGVRPPLSSWNSSSETQEIIDKTMDILKKIEQLPY